MAIMQVYRSVCLHPKLAELWREVRTLPMSKSAGARVGHDSPCEWLHADITTSLTSHVTESSISRFIKSRPFTATVDAQLRSVLGLGYGSKAKLKCMLGRGCQNIEGNVPISNWRDLGAGRPPEYREPAHD